MTVLLSPVGGVAAQFFDNNGNPLSGGKLFSYVSGTTTPQVTYTSANGATAHTNPIVLDSAGRVPSGEIWLTDGQNYKFVLQTSTNVLIATYDNITGINGTGIASNAVNVQYDPAGTGAVATNVQAKLRESVSIRDFGAVGDGVTNDRDAIQAALNTGKSVLIPHGTYLYNTSVTFTADDQCILGFGNDSVLKSATASVYINSGGFDGLTIRDLKIDASAGTDGGIRITDGSQHFDVLNVYFYKGNQRVWLWTCQYVTVQNCTFEENLYGVIAQFGFASSYVLIDGNIAFNMTADFVEANQGGFDNPSVPKSKFWTVSNNIFNGSFGFPTPATEKRFVGITSVEGVVITGNTVVNTTGDAAIHLEDTLGDTVISNNVFKDCVQSDGNSGYIYLLNVDEDTVVANNIFLHGLDTVPASAISVNSGTYALNLIFTGNLVKGTGAVRNFSGCDTGGLNGSAVVSSNIFENVVRAADATNANNVLFTANTVKGADNGISRNVSASSSGGSNWTVSNNTFSSITSADVITSTNTSGTQPPSNWVVTGNRIEKKIEVSDAGNGGANSTQNTRINGNYLATGATIQGSFGGATNQLIADNYQNSSILYQLSNFADDAAAAAGGIAIGGLYRNGSIVQVRVS